jgi:hypothetical protein
MTYAPITRDELEHWAAANTAGSSIRRIAQEAGRDKKVVAAAFRRHGFTIHRHTNPGQSPWLVDWCDECCETRPLNPRTGWCKECSNSAPHPNPRTLFGTM